MAPPAQPAAPTHSKAENSRLEKAMPISTPDKISSPAATHSSRDDVLSMADSSFVSVAKLLFCNVEFYYMHHRRVCQPLYRQFLASRRKAASRPGMGTSDAATAAVLAMTLSPSRTRTTPSASPAAMGAVTSGGNST